MLFGSSARKSWLLNTIFVSLSVGGVSKMFKMNLLLILIHVRLIPVLENRGMPRLGSHGVPLLVRRLTFACVCLKNNHLATFNLSLDPLKSHF